MRPSARWGPGRTWRRRGKCVLLVLGLGILLRCSVADLGRVAGGSMRPTLQDGDRILTNKLAYGLRLPFTHGWLLRWSGPRRGDVVLFSSPVDGRRLVKRVVGVPGDLITAGPRAGRVPAGQYFVLGDDPNSLDSRTFGCVPRACILGRVVGIAFSLDRGGWCPRWGRFFQGLRAPPGVVSRSAS
jgi:signal peptidase I